MNNSLLFWLGFLGVLGLWMLGARNRVVALRAAILTAWAQVDQTLQARGDAIAALLAAVAETLHTEFAALDAVAQAQAQVQAARDALRRKPVQHEAVADLSKADAVLAAVMVRLISLVEQHSALLAEPAVKEPLKTLRELPPRLAFGRQMFNEAGAAYNQAVTQFPTRLLGSVFRFGQAGKL